MNKNPRTCVYKLFMYCIDIPTIFELIYKFMHTNRSLYSASNVCHKLKENILSETDHIIMKHYGKYLSVMTFGVASKSVVTYRNYLDTNPTFNILLSGVLPLSRVVVSLSMTNNSNSLICIEKSCERCKRITSDLSYTLVFIINCSLSGNKYDMMQICTRGCLTVCTHCENDELMYLPFHTPNNGNLPACPKCGHLLMREESIFHQIDGKLDCDYSCTQCRLDHINYKNNKLDDHVHESSSCDKCNIKSLTNDSDLIMRRKRLIEHLHMTVI